MHDRSKAPYHAQHSPIFKRLQARPLHYGDTDRKNTMSDAHFQGSQSAGLTRASLKSSRFPLRSRYVSSSLPSKKNLLPIWLQKAGLGSWAIVGITIIVFGIIYLLAKITVVFTAVFIALILTAILNPVVNFLSKWINRWLAILITFLGFIGLLVGMILLVVTSLISQWRDLLNQFDGGIDKILDLLKNSPFKIKVTHQQISSWIDSSILNAQNYAKNNWSKLVGDIFSNFSVVGIIFTVFALAIFTAFFFLHSGEKMWRWFINLIPGSKRKKTHLAASAGWHAFSSYSRGTVLVAASDAALATIALSLLGVPVAPALGILVFIGAFIPLIGAPIAMLIAMVIALASGGLIKALLVGVLIALIGQLEGHVLQPLIMGHQVSLHPVVVGLGVAIGTVTAGLLGAVIAIPIIGVAWAVFSELYIKDLPYEGDLPVYVKRR